MAKGFISLCGLVACILLAGCASPKAQQAGGGTTLKAPVVPPTGCIFTQVKAPISTKFQSTPVCTKKGEASAEYLLVPIPCYVPCSFAWGACDVDKAAKEGNLSTLEYADYEYTVILGIYQKTTVTAYGE